jgi:Fe2+ transport system protein B
MGNFGTHTHSERNRQQQQQQKNNNQKTHQEQWEVVERGCQAKPKKELEEKEKIPKWPARHHRNGLFFFSLSLGSFFLLFFRWKLGDRKRKKCVK